MVTALDSQVIAQRRQQLAESVSQLLAQLDELDRLEHEQREQQEQPAEIEPVRAFEVATEPRENKPNLVALAALDQRLLWWIANRWLKRSCEAVND